MAWFILQHTPPKPRHRRTSCSIEVLLPCRRRLAGPPLFLLATVPSKVATNATVEALPDLRLGFLPSLPLCRREQELIGAGLTTDQRACACHREHSSNAFKRPSASSNAILSTSQNYLIPTISGTANRGPCPAASASSSVDPRSAYFAAMLLILPV